MLSKIRQTYMQQSIILVEKKFESFEFLCEKSLQVVLHQGQKAFEREFFILEIQ
jgi:hypothetical protein